MDTKDPTFMQHYSTLNIGYVTLMTFCVLRNKHVPLHVYCLHDSNLFHTSRFSKSPTALLPFFSTLLCFPKSLLLTFLHSLSTFFFPAHSLFSQFSLCLSFPLSSTVLLWFSSNLPFAVSPLRSQALQIL